MQPKKVLYITTQITGTERYLTWAAYPAIWYSRIQRNVLNILGNAQGIETSVRFYPNDLWKNPQVEWVKKTYPQIRILDIGVPAVLEKEDFDFIVTEACATTLLEVLCTKSRILAFIPSDFIKLHKDAKEFLAQRICLTETQENYLANLHHMLSAESLNHPLLNINDDFLFKYGLPSSQDNPLILSKKAIETIMQTMSEK